MQIVLTLLIIAVTGLVIYAIIKTNPAKPMQLPPMPATPYEPKPPQGEVPVIIGAAAGPKTFAWIAENADGWMTTPTQADITDKIVDLKQAWADAGRAGAPDIRILIAFKPNPEDLMAWAEAGATELIWGVPDKPEAELLGSLDRLAGRLGLSG